MAKAVVNPMAEAFGPGPERVVCIHCQSFRIANRVCSMRNPGRRRNRNTHNPAWPACSKFQLDPCGGYVREVLD